MPLLWATSRLACRTHLHSEGLSGKCERAATTQSFGEFSGKGRADFPDASGHQHGWNRNSCDITCRFLVGSGARDTIAVSRTCLVSDIRVQTIFSGTDNHGILFRMALGSSPRTSGNDLGLDTSRVALVLRGGCNSNSHTPHHFLTALVWDQPVLANTLFRLGLPDDRPLLRPGSHYTTLLHRDRLCDRRSASFHFRDLGPRCPLMMTSLASSKNSGGTPIP